MKIQNCIYNKIYINLLSKMELKVKTWQLLIPLPYIIAMPLEGYFILEIISDKFK